MWTSYRFPRPTILLQNTLFYFSEFQYNNCTRLCDSILAKYNSVSSSIFSSSFQNTKITILNSIDIYSSLFAWLAVATTFFYIVATWVIKVVPVFGKQVQGLNVSQANLTCTICRLRYAEIKRLKLIKGNIFIVFHSAQA